MKRRTFISSTGLGTGAILLTSCSQYAGNKATIKDPLVEKVKLAMLTIQRMSWEQGVAAQALLESGEKELTILLAREAVLRRWKDGRLAMVDSQYQVTDPAVNGEPVLFAYAQTGDSKLKAAADEMLEYLLKQAPRTADGTLYHINSAPQLWIDSMYMAPPFLAIAGQHAEAVRQVEGYRRYLWNSREKLFSHIWDNGKNEFERKDFWGVGNGWAAAGMTRVAMALPSAMESEKNRLVEYIRELIDGCMKYQRKDGLFHNIVDKPETFVETNLAQMLACTIYRGVKAGWFSGDYLPKADLMRNAARNKVDDSGFVQGICGSPDFNHSGTACEGQAFFLMMEAAYRNLNAT